MAATLQDRIRAASSVNPKTQCWEWQRGMAAGGYGQITVAGRRTKAHRAAYEAFVGPIPDGLQIDHLCRVRSCVNPEHLEPVTGSENVQRGLPYRGSFSRDCNQCGQAYHAMRSTSKFCSSACRAAHRRNPSEVEIISNSSDGTGERIQPGFVSQQVEVALDAAKGQLQTEDLAAVAMLRALALKLDRFAPEGLVDTDTAALFLRYCDALGLTPTARGKLREKKPAKAPSSVSRLRAVATGGS